MKVAIVLTVKNEERLLRHNLLYHKAIGASHCFVYFDDSTDGGKLSIQDLDFVTSQDSVVSENYEHLEFLNKFTSQAQEHHTARQCLNTYDALVQCRAHGYQWLISIDADELVCTDENKPSQLGSFFSEISEDIDLVHLKTYEALQRKESYGNVFAEETFFKTSHKYEFKFEKILKKFFNPFTQTYQKFAYWYGQHLGKGAIRVTSDIIPHNVHKYILVSGKPINSAHAGSVLHYHAYDAADFIKKFTNFSNHPDTFLSGNMVKSQKLLLRDVVNKAGYTNDQLVDYFNDNLLFHPQEVQNLVKNRYFLVIKRKKKPLKEIRSVKQVFTQMNKR